MTYRNFKISKLPYCDLISTSYVTKSNCIYPNITFINPWYLALSSMVSLRVQETC